MFPAPASGLWIHSAPSELYKSDPELLKHQPFLTPRHSEHSCPRQGGTGKCLRSPPSPFLWETQIFTALLGGTEKPNCCKSHQVAYFVVSISQTWEVINGGMWKGWLIFSAESGRRATSAGWAALRCCWLPGVPPSERQNSIFREDIDTTAKLLEVYLCSAKSVGGNILLVGACARRERVRQRGMFWGCAQSAEHPGNSERVLWGAAELFAS